MSSSSTVLSLFIFFIHQPHYSPHSHHPLLSSSLNPSIKQEKEICSIIAIFFLLSSTTNQIIFIFSRESCISGFFWKESRNGSPKNPFLSSLEEPINGGFFFQKSIYMKICMGGKTKNVCVCVCIAK